MRPHLTDLCRDGSFCKTETIGEIKQEGTDLTETFLSLFTMKINKTGKVFVSY